MSWYDLSSLDKNIPYNYGQDLFLDILKELKAIRKLLEKSQKPKDQGGLFE